MCILMTVVGLAPDYPVVLGANRDEAPGREGSAPRLVRDRPRTWAGLDPRAGGAWMGLNERGVVAVLTNRATPCFDSRLRSRGLLVLDVLRRVSAEGAVRTVRTLCAARRYNHFNLFCADRSGAFVLYYTGRVETQRVPPGVHVLSHAELDDPLRPKVRRAHDLLRRNPPPQTVEAWIERLKAVCADEDTAVAAPERICVRAGVTRTLSSTLLALHATDMARSAYWHRLGLPGEGEYKDYSGMLRG